MPDAPSRAKPVEPIADAYHDAYRAWAKLDDRVTTAVMEADPAFDWYDSWTDDYDNSIEFNVDASAVPSAAVLAAIKSLGFDRCWFNFSDGTEQYCNGERRKVEWPRFGAGCKSPTLRTLLSTLTALRAEAEASKADKEKLTRALAALLKSIHENAPPALAATILSRAPGAA